MPAGTYAVLDGAGGRVGSERFRCGPGPAGWRYFAEIETTVPEPHSETVDLAVDSGWRPVRLRIETGDHSFMAAPDGGELRVLHDGADVVLPFDDETELDYLSPAFNAVTANRLGGSRDVDVVYLDPVTCEAHTVRQRYELGSDEEIETAVGRFGTTRWHYTALESGFTRPFWVAGDVVVRYEGVFELIEYEPGASGPAPR